MCDTLVIILTRKDEDGSGEIHTVNMRLRGVKLKLTGPKGGSVSFHPIRLFDRDSQLSVDTVQRILLHGGRIIDDDDHKWELTDMILCLRNVDLDIDIRHYRWMTHGHHLLFGFHYDLETMFQTHGIRESVACTVAGALRRWTAFFMVSRAMRRWLADYRNRQVAAAREALSELLHEPYLVSDVLDAVLAH